MSTGTLAPNPYLTVLDANGHPVAGAKITTYLAGTTTPVATYPDSALTPGTENANPIVADSSGRYVAFLTPGVSYKFVITDAANVPIRTRDGISATPLSAGTFELSGLAGENLAAGQAVYQSDGSGGKAAGSWYLTDATNTYSSTTPLVGFAIAAITQGSSGTIRLGGQVPNLTALTQGAAYYLATSPGTVTTTAPANRRFVGVADTTTSLVVFVNPAITALAGPTTDLLFTPDATYDLGKSGATRPRDGFFSRNVVIGGTLGVTGAITGNVTGNASGSAGSCTGNAATATTATNTTGGTVRAVDGSVAAPGFGFSSETSTGHYRVQQGAVGVAIRGAVYFAFDDGSAGSNLGPSVRPANDNQSALGWSGLRWTAVYATNGTIQTSDRHSKHDIADADVGLDFVNALKPRRFVMNDEQEGTYRYGFIAQEVLDTLKGRTYTGLVMGSPGSYGMNYATLVTPLVQAVQELSAQVLALTDRVTALEKV